MSGYKRVNFYDLCRLCATHQQREKTHIFKEQGRKIGLQNKIQDCLSLQVSETDFLPKVVCSKCMDSLEKSSSFRRDCCSSETMLLSYFNNFRHTEEFKKSGKVYIKEVSQKSVATEVEMDLNLQPSVTMTTSSTNTDCTMNVVPNFVPQEIMPCYTLQIPQVSTIASTPVIHQAMPPPLLQQTHESSKLMQPQVVYNHKLPQNLIKNSNTIPGAISVRVNANGEIIGTAPVDFNTFMNQQKLIEQRKIPESSNIVEIDLTDEPDNKQNPMYNQQHINSPQTSMNVISVPYDSVMVNAKDSSTPSPTPVYEPQPLCEFAPPPPLDIYTSPTKQQYTAPDQNEELKSFSCSACSKSFKKREHLYQHIKLHSGFRPYKCINCSKSYIRKEHLMRHLTSHSGEKKFLCEICKRSFSRHDNLLKHKKTHERPNYTCEICQRKFLLEHFFLAHKTTHDMKINLIDVTHEGKCSLMGV